jgi:hypothetical protein
VTSSALMAPDCNNGLTALLVIGSILVLGAINL